MSASKGWRVLVFGIVLTILSASVSAQTKVYKWVDENGVVHFSEEPPIVAPEVKVEIITTSPARTPSPQVQTTVKPPARTKAKVESLTVQPDDEVPPLAKPVDIKKMSLEELGRRCEDAREAMIAPLRKAEIDKCVETGTGDQAWCRTFWADYGAPSRTATGVFIPGMFYDLRECTEAFDERNRRGLYPGDDR
jgi:hypothetical protein